MSVVDAIRDRIAEPERRHALRLLRPRVQLTLAAYLLAVSFVFGALMAFNSWSAYGRLFEGTLSTAAAPFRQDIAEQSRLYMQTSLALAGGYVVAMLLVTVAYLHRVVGPTIALERHVRALQRGEYGSRVALRSSDHLYAELADQLNELAARLESTRRR